MSSFDLLARPVQKWVHAQKWQDLRLIQSQAIEVILKSDNDVIIAAETAGGKTEAAFLPLITQIINLKESLTSGFDILYVSPLKALINDQYSRLDLLCKEAEIAVTPWHGDSPQSGKQRAFKNPSGIVLITPESIEALFNRKSQYIERLFGSVRAVIIDELHSFLDSERGIHLRSLLARIELLSSNRIKRIGLSATLGDMNLACRYLRQDAPDQVSLITAPTDQSELLVQVKGYSSTMPLDPQPEKDIAKHLYSVLRGKNNLIFANARRSVEVYADLLRYTSEKNKVSLEFFPHHGNISKGHREDVEKRLKTNVQPTSAICTSTLELGIDIGSVDCVAQVGAPLTVSSLRQRLGRSGRRIGQKSVLRQYNIESKIDENSRVVDKLRLGLYRSVAMIDLIIDGWCEPPKPQSLHLSTLVHQILSIISQRDGATAKRLYDTLCAKGPFDAVSVDLFIEVLQHLAIEDVGLIEQGEDGSLLLGEKGEKIVANYHFHSVFKTPEEYRINHEGKELGTLPVDYVVSKGATIIFIGKRWKITAIDDSSKVILVQPAPEALAPIFGGEGGEVHDRVISKMRSLYLGEKMPLYLDEAANELFAEGQKTFSYYNLAEQRIIEEDKNRTLIATGVGTVKTNTLGIAFGSFGYTWKSYDGYLSLTGGDAERGISDVLRYIKSGQEIDLSGDDINLNFEKFHPFLSRELLLKDALSSRIDLESLPMMAEAILAG